tara:strand:- start:31 stop:375 length:345 start_codon:yes stop_codon:yes gene_type:complete
MTQSEVFALYFAAIFVLLILFIIFASKNKKLKKRAKQNTKNQELILRNFGTDYWGYMIGVNFANVGLLILIHNILGNIVLFLWPLVLVLFSPINNWYYNKLLEKSKLREKKQNE